MDELRTGERSFVLVKPSNEVHLPEIRAVIRAQGVYIIRERVLQLTQDQVTLLYRDKVGWDFFEELVAYLTSDKSILWVVGGTDTVQRVLAVKGKTFSGRGIRGLYATDFIHNVMHCSDSVEEAEYEIGLFFGGGQQ